ncbi:hypothetical protein D3C76_1700550 [compost metagenome]
MFQAETGATVDVSCCVPATAIVAVAGSMLMLVTGKLTDGLLRKVVIALKFKFTAVPAKSI